MRATWTAARPPRAPRLRALAAAIVVALLGALVTLAAVPSAGAQVAPRPTLDMKVLVIAADGSETDLPSIRSSMEQVGQPYAVLTATTNALTASTLIDPSGKGRYNGIVLTTGNLVYHDAATGNWPSAFTPEEWATLRDYQSRFGVRSVTSYTFPEAAYGLSYAGYTDTLGATLPATLTTTGRGVWPYLNATGSVPLSGAWVYLGTVLDPAVTTPLLNVTVGGQAYPVASVTRYAGYENLAITAANNPNLVHSLLLSTGWINWVTKGNWLGNRAPSTDIQIDDLFMTDGVWNTTANAATDEYRNTPGDLDALVRYQNARRADPLTPGFRTEFAYNGETAGDKDPLTMKAESYGAEFGFINHTRTHYNLDCGDCPDPTGVITTTAAEIQDQIKTNREYLKWYGLSGDPDTLVQPDISGINTPPNPMAQKAAGDAGIRWWIGDTSRPGQGNPSFNVGFPTAGDARVYVVPRTSNNLFVAASTPDQWVGVYNHFYAPGGVLCGTTTCFDRPQNYAEILDHESDYLLRYLIRGDLNPWMFHTPNVRAYDGNRSLLGDLFDATMAKYRALVSQPIRTLSFKQAGQAMQARGAYDAAGLTASVTPCQSITLTAAKAATVPVNGVSYVATNSTVENVGGRTVSNVKLAAGQTVTIPLPACPVDPTPGCPGVATQSLVAVADTYASQEKPTSNFGKEASVAVKASANKNKRAYLKFTLPPVPTGCRLLSAQFALRTTTLKSGLAYQVQRATAPWTEAGLTWANQPAAAGTPSLRATGSGTVTWDVTSLVADSYPADYGLVVRDANEGTSTSNENKYGSRESSNPPRLTLVFG